MPLPTNRAPGDTVTAADLNAIAAAVNATATLANAVPGTVLAVDWNGSAWTYNGAAITSRPTTSTHVRFLLVDPTGDATFPAWALAGVDMLAQQWG